MITQHTKSSCCNAKIRGYGGRRLQCAKCLGTWSRYPHKRGPKKERRNYNLLRRVVLKNKKLEDQRDYFSNLSTDAIRKRFNRTLEHFVSRERYYPGIEGKYILLADGLHFRIKKQEWVLYLLILKPRHRNKAYILDPVIIRGGEKFNNWKQAIETIPEDIRKRIIVLVSDNFRTSGSIAKHFGWVHQLCQFHLIAALQKRRCRRKRMLPGRSIREEVYQTVRRLLEETDLDEMASLKGYLKRLSLNPDCPKSISMIVNEFLYKVDKYRTSLQYPNLTIPKTNNPVESLGKLVRERTRRVNSPYAIQQWAIAFARLRKSIVCNGQSKRKIPQK